MRNGDDNDNISHNILHQLNLSSTVIRCMNTLKNDVIYASEFFERFEIDENYCVYDMLYIIYYPSST